MIDFILAVSLIAGLGALFGGLKGARIAVGLAFALVVLGLAGVFGYAEYNEHVRIQEQHKQREAQVQACRERLKKVNNSLLQPGETLGPPVIDYDALAKQYGAISSTPAASTPLPKGVTPIEDPCEDNPDAY
jgi:hypothetical protein